jgi:hypothetical protein
VIALFLSMTLGLQNTKPAAPAAPAEAVSPAKTPEEALRLFVIATLTRDEAALRAVSLPDPGLAFLLQGASVPAEQLEGVKEQVAKLPIKALKPGDTYTLPGNRTMTVKPEEVTAERVVLLPQGAPVPTRCRKVGDRWKVDPAPVIAARKAAQAAREKKTKGAG